MTTPHHTYPCHLRPSQTTPIYTTSQHSTSPHTTSHHTTPPQTTPHFHHITPPQTTPRFHHTTPHHTFTTPSIASHRQRPVIELPVAAAEPLTERPWTMSFRCGWGQSRDTMAPFASPPLDNTPPGSCLSYFLKALYWEREEEEEEGKGVCVSVGLNAWLQFIFYYSCSD